MAKTQKWIIAMALGLGLAACSVAVPNGEADNSHVPIPQTPRELSSTPAPAPAPPGPLVAPEGPVYDQVGKTSFYSDVLQGRLTASEEPYDKAKFTAAHRKLPFGSLLRVTNINNGKSVLVRVNDRGPFAHSRVLDVSRAAAEALGLVRAGVAKMRITLVRKANGDVVVPQWLENADGHLPVPDSLLTAATPPAAP